MDRPLLRTVGYSRTSLMLLEAPCVVKLRGGVGEDGTAPVFVDGVEPEGLCAGVPWRDKGQRVCYDMDYPSGEEAVPKRGALDVMNCSYA